MNPSAEIQECADNVTGFAGTLRNIQLTDIIQMCCLAGASICVSVKQGTDAGTIYIKDGNVIHAEWKKTEGLKAFFTILEWKKGVFETQDFCEIDNPTIKEPCQFLLMEAARLSDEITPMGESAEIVKTARAEKMRVLIVDDSPVMSKIIASMLVADPAIEVIGSAKNGEEALEMLKDLRPDLITMDVNMPVMNGSTALKHIMVKSPCPVMIMSNIAPSSHSTILSFLNLGAVDFMSKPVKTRNIIIQQQKMVERIHIAAKAKAKRFQRLRCAKIDPSRYITIHENDISKKLIIINSGVGGYLEMVNVVTALPEISNSAIISLQSIPPAFAETLAKYLNYRSTHDIAPLKKGKPLCPGRCYIGTTGNELIVENNKILKNMNRGATEGIDEFLISAVRAYGGRVLLVLLSGADLGQMQGIEEIRKAGGKIICPKLSSCILPASLEPVVDSGLVSKLFEPCDIPKIMAKFCV